MESVCRKWRRNSGGTQLRIVIVSETLVAGGAETFVLRLAAAFQARGVEVSIYALRADKVNRALVQSIAPDVAVSCARIPFLPIILRFDGFLFLLKSKFSLLRWLQARWLKKYLRAVSADVIHSNLLTSDLVAALVSASFPIPWVTTIHGDYLHFETMGTSRNARIQNFGWALAQVRKSVDRIACLSERQMQEFEELFPDFFAKKRISKIYNGYATPIINTSNQLPVAIAHIPPNAFVVGMVARGIREKGWEILISAFLNLNLPESWLVLVGDGSYLQQIRSETLDNRIVFTGNVVDPMSYIARFDVGCLPSRYRSESLPTVVIEYLMLGKPVIASDIGELSEMLNEKTSTPAGLIIRLGSTEEMTERLEDALRRLYHDRAMREFLEENTARASRKFDMDACLDAYIDVYRSALNERFRQLDDNKMVGPKF